MMVFTETWLDDSMDDSSLWIEGCGVPVQLNRDKHMTGKERGGGVCLYRGKLV